MKYFLIFLKKERILEEFSHRSLDFAVANFQNLFDVIVAFNLSLFSDSRQNFIYDDGNDKQADCHNTASHFHIAFHCDVIRNPQQRITNQRTTNEQHIFENQAHS